MRTIRTKVYTFKELNTEAQETAIENNCDINVEHDWWNFTYQDAKESGIKLTGFDLEHRPIADGNFIESAYDCATKIIKNHGETCESYKSAVKFINEIITEETEARFLHEVLCYYVDYLQKECDYLQTDEAIKETLISNNYEFLSNGKIISL